MQNQYNLAYRADDAFIEELAAANIAYVPFWPLGGISPLQSETLTAVAAQIGATPMQTALSWLLQRSANILEGGAHHAVARRLTEGSGRRTRSLRRF